MTLCREDGRYEAGGLLVAKWRISRVRLDQLQGLEVSVLWHTEGKGDEDLHVHHFHRLTAQQLRGTGLADEQSIQSRLPVSPLSYFGKLITIRWSLRLRLFLSAGREILSEQPFCVVAPTIDHDFSRRQRATRPLTRVVDWSTTESSAGLVSPLSDIVKRPIVKHPSSSSTAS